MSNAMMRVETFDSDLKAEKDYWLAKAPSELTPSNIRADNARPASYAAGDGRLDISLPEDLSAMVTRLAGNSSFLTYAILMAALKICLHRYSGQDTITVGSPARRKKGDAECPTNALPIIDAVDGSRRFKEFLVQVRETLADAYRHQDYPFDHLIMSLDLDHIENRCPLFDVALVLENIHAPLPDVRNDITLNFAISGGAISGFIQFNSILFKAETIERFSGHLLTILRSAVENIDSPIDELEMVSERERQQLIADWNATAKDFSRDVCVQWLVEAQVARTPEAIALTFDGEKLTYREMNGRANQLARHLRSLGVGPEVIVAVCAERSFAAITALLGILKAGGVYLPIDPQYPKERIDFLLNDAGVSILLTQQAVLERLPEYEGKVVCLDSDWEAIAGQSADDLDGRATHDNSAYVIYTSGSTGQPKGVVIQHRGLCNMVEAQIRAFGVHSDSRVIQLASLSFDASVSEIFMALASGATLCLGVGGAIFSGDAFLNSLRQEAVTTATIPPAILAALPFEELPELRTIISAGEQCTAELARQWSSGRSFINAYGPTETTVCAAVCEWVEEYGQTAPIGRPIANTEIYLLDSYFRPVPVGITGELFIGGVGLARCYLNRPDLTAEKFLPHPFSSEPGARLYRSGDLARYLSDGNIEFIGRSDNQVKIRGYRIEIGEVEAALDHHPAIRESVVVVREDTAGEKILVAYAIARPDAQVSSFDLRDFLREKLPEYMLPSNYVMLDAYPLTPSGKIDYHALPSPTPGRSKGGGEFVPPSTPIEKKLTEIWSELLGVEEVDVNNNLLIGINDHFFDLGGHSLLAVRMFARVREAFGVELPMNIIFTSAPTIAGLADAIEGYIIEQANCEELITMLKDLDGLSDEEVQNLIESEISSEQNEVN